MSYNPRNPNNEPTGHWTGRCGNCGSDQLWDDNLSYGCRACGSSWGPDQTGLPRLVRSAPAPYRPPLGTHSRYSAPSDDIGQYTAGLQPDEDVPE